MRIGKVATDLDGYNEGYVKVSVTENATKIETFGADRGYNYHWFSAAELEQLIQLCQKALEAMKAEK